VPFRQLASVLIGLIVIMSAALFIITRGGGSDGSSASTNTITTTSTTVPATVVTAPPTTPPPTTTIPTECAAPADTAGSVGATTTTMSTSTTTSAADPSQAPEATAEPTLGSNSSVSTVGLDRVTFGLTVKQAIAAAATPMIPCSPPSDCYRVTPLEAPEGISFVVSSGTIERVDIIAGPITTKSGLGIGTSETRIVESLGDKLDRKVNDDGSIDLIFVPTDANDANFRVIFTIRDGVVDSFRSGRVPLVLPADACSA